MGLFKRKKAEPEGATAVAERPAARSLEEIAEEIEALSAANREGRDVERERRILRLRHEEAMAIMDAGVPAPPQFATPASALPTGSPLPEVQRADLTPELLRAGILRDGCLLVRGLIPREEALALADEIDRSFVERDRQEASGADTDGYYEPFEPDERFTEPSALRPWIKEGGGVLAGDSPKLAFELFELFQQAGLPHLIKGYLGEDALISLEKTTLRKAEPTVAGAWHQDGAFMGEVRAMNLWLSLSRCGDVAPGLDIVPRRLEDYVTAQTDEAVLDFQVSQSQAEQAAGDLGIQRPIFEPGDALFFDERFLHSTGSDPSMPNPRYAVESWFFGGSGFPTYAPIAV